MTIRNESDLLKLCWTPVTVRFSSLYSNDQFSINYAAQRYKSGHVSTWNRSVEQLGEALRNCSPAVRREFVATLCSINKLDSLFPVRPDNPLKEQLSQGDL